MRLANKWFNIYLQQLLVGVICGQVGYILQMPLSAIFIMSFCAGFLNIWSQRCALRIDEN